MNRLRKWFASKGLPIRCQVQSYRIVAHGYEADGSWARTLEIHGQMSAEKANDIADRLGMDGYGVSVMREGGRP